MLSKFSTHQIVTIFHLIHHVCHHPDPQLQPVVQQLSGWHQLQVGGRGQPHDGLILM